MVNTPGLQTQLALKRDYCFFCDETVGMQPATGGFQWVKTQKQHGLHISRVSYEDLTCQQSKKR